jgi:hypothetical protein
MKLFDLGRLKGRFEVTLLIYRCRVRICFSRKLTWKKRHLSMKSLLLSQKFRKQIKVLLKQRLLLGKMNHSQRLYSKMIYRIILPLYLIRVLRIYHKSQRKMNQNKTHFKNKRLKRDQILSQSNILKCH